MKKTKRLLALLLIINMMLPGMPLNVFAEESGPGVSLTGDYYDVDVDGKVIGTGTDDPEKMIEDTGSDSYIKMSKSAATTNNENEFEITLNVETTENVEKLSKQDAVSVVLVLDVSASMDKMVNGTDMSTNNINSGAWKLSGTRWMTLKEIARDYIEKLLAANPNNQVSIVVYGGRNSLPLDTVVHKTISNWSSDADTAINSFYGYNFVDLTNADYYTNIKGLPKETSLRYDIFGDTFIYYGATNCQAGFRGAIEELENDNSGNNQHVIFMSDGKAEGSYDSTSYATDVSAAAAIAEAKKLKDAYPDSTLYTVGFANDAANSAVLSKTTNTSVDAYYHSNNAADLANTFEEMLSNVSMLSRAWTVTDPMPDYVTLDFGSIIAESAAAYSLNGENVLTWDMKNCEPSYTMTDNKGNTVYGYTLTYTITVDPADLEEGTYYPTNLQTTLTYAFSAEDGNLPEELSTENFLVPTVKLAEQYEVSYTVTGEAPSSSSTMPEPASYYEGDEVTVAAGLATTSITNSEGKTGTWTFDGWTTDDATVIDGKFNMPNQAVELTGTWTFIQNEYGVKYEFVSSDGSTLPQEVLDLLPNDDIKYKDGDVVTAITPDETTIETNDGVWMFTGWDEDSITVDDESVIFTGTWTFTPAPEMGIYTVVYNPNGGVGDLHSATESIGNEHTVLRNTDSNLGFTREKCIFLG